MILVFSGTGNSLFVANKLSEISGDKVITLPTTKPVTMDNNRIIWVFPVYSWGIPPVIARNIATLQISGDDKSLHFAVMTCGDDVGLTDQMWSKAITKRGWTYASTYSVQMPNTYVLMKGFDTDSIEKATEKINNAGERIQYIANRIKLQCEKYATDNSLTRENDLVRGNFAWIKTQIIYPWFKRYAMSPKPFFANDECISCRLCADSCPLSNIQMQDAKPKWGDNCTLCLRCYHICPRHAVAYSNATAGKGQSRLLISECIKSLKTDTED